MVQDFDEIEVDQITESRISSVVAMLPTSLQSGMGPIRFLRRSISLHTLRPGVLVSERKPRPLSDTSVAKLTQEPLVTEIMDQDDVGRDQDPKTAQVRPMSKVLYSEAREDAKPARAASGVHWKFARQGTSLVNISTDGGKPAVGDEDILFERKAFIDGVTYLLKALPQDLDACELERIHAALPKNITQPNVIAVRPEAGSTAQQMSSNCQPRSILHRGVQMTVVNLVFVLSFLMPYVVYLVRSAARMERKYKLSERVVGHGVQFANSIGKQSASLTETVCQMNDGKVGQALTEAVIWTVDSVAQGISDGVGEGLSKLSGRNGGSVRNGSRIQ